MTEMGSPPARYPLIEDDGGVVTIELVALGDDLASAAKGAAANGNPGWAHALETRQRKRDHVLGRVTAYRTGQPTERGRERAE